MGQGTSSEGKKVDLRASTDWRPDESEKEVKGTDATISVGDLLRTTTTEIKYDLEPKKIEVFYFLIIFLLVRYNTEHVNKSIYQ